MKKTYVNIKQKDNKWICHFYDTRPLSYFSSFFKNIDAIVSPNRPNALGKGFFDGFPLASSVMAGLHGVPMILSDELEENYFLEDKEDFILVNPKKKCVVDGIGFLIKNPDKLPKIGLSRKGKMDILHSYDKHIGERVELIRNTIS